MVIDVVKHVAMVVLAATVVGGCASGAPALRPGRNFPAQATRTVAVGTTVKWTWANGAVNHNVTFDDGTKSATQNTGTYSRQFNTAGTYNYPCTIHGPSMSGTITVQ